jgi:hypothetical protein
VNYSRIDIKKDKKNSLLNFGLVIVGAGLELAEIDNHRFSSEMSLDVVLGICFALAFEPKKPFFQKKT